MALHDSILKLITKEQKDPDAPKPPVGSRTKEPGRTKAASRFT